jgi:hypothetical protein
MQYFVNPFSRKDSGRQPLQQIVWGDTLKKKKSKEEQTIPSYWLISAKNKVAVRNRAKTLLHQTSPKMIKLHHHSPDSPLERLERVMAGISKGTDCPP